MKAHLFKEAKRLRRKGFSFKEIGEQLNVAKSTASLWLKDVKLSTKAKKRINQLGIDGREKGGTTNKTKRDAEKLAIFEKVEKYFSTTNFSKIDSKIECALLYWCEGSKCESNKFVSFINSDPEMIKYFLDTFRKSF